MRVCVCVCVCVRVCVCVCLSVCLSVSHHQFVWFWLLLCTLIRYMVLWVFFFMLSWMFQYDYLDTCCFECHICMCFVVSYLHLFSAIEHVSQRKAL